MHISTYTNAFLKWELVSECLQSFGVLMMSVLIELILHLLSSTEESTKSNHSPEMQTHISGLFLGGTQRHLKAAVRGHLRIKRCFCYSKH